ncbi:MAG: hypothetical protein QGH76_06275 [Phycisphaerales bacterium]|jgi:hypothetical protein|nr:hypothetical protein [Phycisphaerales bacterium]
MLALACTLITAATGTSTDADAWIIRERATETHSLVHAVVSAADNKAMRMRFGDEVTQNASLSSEELAKKLVNPVASLISVPIQSNYDQHIGPDGAGDRFLINVQPVVPISLNEDWNLISRTIVPLVHQSDVLPGMGDQSGMGDILQSLFFSPVKPTKDDWIWGAGPVFLLPSATDDLLGGEKWGAGPTFVALQQTGPWTYGALMNHVWSFAGASDRADTNATFLQPFVSYTTSDAWTYTLELESTYDWETSDWSVPIIGVVSKVLTVGEQRINIFGGIKYWAASPQSGADDFGFRLGVSLLFPR